MLLPAPVLVALLLAPIELLEERTLHDGAPATETVTVRGLWPRREGALALLPPSVTFPRPFVHLVGRHDPLPLRATPRGWAAVLPAGEGPATRLVATVTRPVEGARMFRLRWPLTADLDAPTRRVATLPRRLLDGPSPSGWTCPDADLPVRDCVSRDATPPPVISRWTPPRSPRGSVALALALTALAFGWVGRARDRRSERLLAAAGGVAVALAVALSIVGAGLRAWGPALAMTLPLGALAASQAPTHPRGRLFGALSLLGVPLLAVLGAPWGAVFGLGVVGAVACLPDVG